ncbi:MAG: hypothetical protein IJH70_14135 [Oscillospiraceae bacterium]|nr:hypothetical protein [Oscillospiraceae bacterium]
MKNETERREWFGAVRTAADKAIEALADPPARNTLGRVKTDILLRNHLCNGVQMLIAQTEGVARMEADEIRDAIFSELIEDAVAGIWSADESMEIARFLEMCMNTNSSTNRAMFAELLRRALDKNVSGEEAATLADTADRELERFTAQRKDSRTAK